ncbi:hypothetical protein [Rubripirellula reticaptiva]|uniref:YHS domain protein n=1 Tax=Rubripirellula reticaptiva TaxID=2528013 RepID=A0A5C6FFC0_9BACT|nr:hypothetical protein [Rubripirellula reticaptiva]TWU58329.1 hypothetical protein Poly59_12400 [Rubripirellula reticaptiva]
MQRFTILTLMAVLISAAGCGSKNEPTAETLAPDQATLASLAAADRLDGTEDHVIGKCYVCNLGMDGKDEFTAEVHGYQAKLCSNGCLDHFQSDPDSIIASTKVPE